MDVRPGYLQLASTAVHCDDDHVDEVGDAGDDDVDDDVDDDA